MDYDRDMRAGKTGGKPSPPGKHWTEIDVTMAV